jgi:hypothetical protein
LGKKCNFGKCVPLQREAEKEWLEARLILGENN